MSEQFCPSTRRSISEGNKYSCHSSENFKTHYIFLMLEAGKGGEDALKLESLISPVFEEL
jgi:hypothetical protein